MSTLADLRTRVISYLDQGATEAQPYWTVPELNTWINQAFFFYYQWIVKSWENYFARDIFFDLVSGQGNYPLPNDFLKIRLLERVFQNLTVPLRNFERQETANLMSFTNVTTAYLPTYRFEGNYIVIEPTPNITITNGFRLEYIPVPDSLVMDSDALPVGFNKMWEEPLVLRAVISAKNKEEMVGGQGADISSLEKLIEGWEQNIKETMDVRTVNRQYTETFGIDETNSVYFP